MFIINGKQVSLERFVNKEQLIELVLEYMMLADNREPLDSAINILALYVLEEHPNANEQEIIQYIEELVTQHVIESLVKRDIIEVGFQNDAVTYTIAPEWKDKLNGSKNRQTSNG